MAFAEGTTVSFEKSIAEIMETLNRAGADQIGQMQSRDRFTVQFTLADRMVRFNVPFKSIADMPTHDGRRVALTNQQREAKLAQSKRQRGRALMLVIKAKMESIESGIETFEEAFLAHVVMANGQTVYERINDGIALEYKTGAPALTFEPRGGQ